MKDMIPTSQPIWSGIVSHVLTARPSASASLRETYVRLRRSGWDGESLEKCCEKGRGNPTCRKASPVSACACLFASLLSEGTCDIGYGGFRWRGAPGDCQMQGDVRSGKAMSMIPGLATPLPGPCQLQLLSPTHFSTTTTTTPPFPLRCPLLTLPLSWQLGPQQRSNHITWAHCSHYPATDPLELESHSNFSAGKG